MATVPQTPEDMQTRLDEIETLIQAYTSSPAKFSESIAGSVKVSIPDYVQFLKEERELLTARLNATWLKQSDVEEAR